MLRGGAAARTLLVSPGGCRVTLRAGTHSTTFELAPDESLSLPDLHRTPAPEMRSLDAVNYGVVESHVPPGEARVKLGHRDDGGEIVTLENERTHATIDARAGARIFSLLTPDWDPPTFEAIARLDRASGVPLEAAVFDATGALRDDLSAPLPASPRDYIAKYTHAYSTGTFNRAYAVDVLSSGTRASVRFSYTMPDADPAGLTFERIVSLEPGTTRVVVDERLVPPPGAPATQRAVVRSSLPYLAAGVNARIGTAATPLDPLPRERAGDVPSQQTMLGGYLGGVAFVVAWPPGAVERATWTPYFSTGTLSLTLARGWRRTTYSAAEVGDVAAARAFAEAERAWVAANPGAGP